jgi:lactam utilization protein B
VTRTIDLVADVGESFGDWRMGADDEMVETRWPVISAAPSRASTSPALTRSRVTRTCLFTGQ